MTIRIEANAAAAVRLFANEYEYHRPHRRPKKSQVTQLWQASCSIDATKAAEVFMTAFVKAAASHLAKGTPGAARTARRFFNGAFRFVPDREVVRREFVNQLLRQAASALRWERYKAGSELFELASRYRLGLDENPFFELHQLARLAGKAFRRKKFQLVLFLYDFAEGYLPKGESKERINYLFYKAGVDKGRLPKKSSKLLPAAAFA